MGRGRAVEFFSLLTLLNIIFIIIAFIYCLLNFLNININFELTDNMILIGGIVIITVYVILIILSILVFITYRMHFFKTIIVLIMLPLLYFGIYIFNNNVVKFSELDEDEIYITYTQNVIKNMKKGDKQDLYSYQDLVEYLDGNLDDKEILDSSYAYYFEEDIYICLTNGKKNVSGYENNLEVSHADGLFDSECKMSFTLDQAEEYIFKYLLNTYNKQYEITDCKLKGDTYSCSASYDGITSTVTLSNDRDAIVTLINN